MLRRRARHRHDHRAHLIGVVTHRATAAALASATILVVGIITAGCDTFTDEPAATPPARGVVDANAVVAFVIDGDTIDVRIGDGEERVRLIGIDTPEIERRSPDGANSPAECFGPEATAFTESLLPVGTPVRLERDIVGRDDFGRLLAYVYVADDGTFVNYELIRQGFATPLSIEPNTTFASEFVAAATAAESADLGLWRACTDSTR